MRSVVVLALSLLVTVVFALHRKGDVIVSMCIFRRVFEFTITAKDVVRPAARKQSTKNVQSK
jgi:hypothetical protein